MKLETDVSMTSSYMFIVIYKVYHRYGNATKVIQYFYLHQLKINQNNIIAITQHLHNRFGIDIAKLAHNNISLPVHITRTTIIKVTNLIPNKGHIDRGLLPFQSDEKNHQQQKLWEDITTPLFKSIIQKCLLHDSISTNKTFFDKTADFNDWFNRIIKTNLKIDQNFNNLLHPHDKSNAQLNLLWIGIFLKEIKPL